MRTEWTPEQVCVVDPALYPFVIKDADGKIIDRAGNVESAVSVLYGDLSRHDGRPRSVLAPAADVDRLRWNADINADCFGIPLDKIEAA